MRIATGTIGAVLAAMCFWSTTGAQAEPISYGFTVTTNGSSTVSGQLTFDADDGPSGTYSNVAIAVTNPSDTALDGTYTNVCPAADCPVFPPKAGQVVVMLNPPTANLLNGQPVLFLFFTPSLSDAAGPAAVEVLSGTCNKKCSGADLADGGFGFGTAVVLIPVPTLSNWGVVVFSSLLSGFAVVRLRSRTGSA
jgi:hypothetical protein